MKFAIVNGSYSPLFPHLPFCGAERWVSTLCHGMYKRNIPFYVISPQRAIKDEVPFEIVETIAKPEFEVGVTNYINEVYQILKGRNDFDVIISNSNWSAVLGEIKPCIVNLHDGHDKMPVNWLVDAPNTYYRFVSKSQHDRLCPAHLKDKSFWHYLGLPEEEFQLFDSTKGYFLFVSSLYWNPEAKGVDLFLTLAKNNPQKQFKLYGTGNKTLETFLVNFSQQSPNFEFCGKLEDKDRNRVFGEARAFCQLSRLKESFGTSVVSSLAKGKPVIGLDAGGATRELCDRHFPAQKEYVELQNLLYEDYSPMEVFQYSKKFHIDKEIDSLLTFCKTIV